MADILGSAESLLHGHELLDYVQQSGHLTVEEARAEVAVVEDLRSAGVQLNSLWDLVNSRSRPPAAFPILLRHITRPHPDIVRQGIARSLATRGANFAWEALAVLYQAETDPTPNGFKGTLALALSESANTRVLPHLISLFRDRSQGESRLYFVNAIHQLGGKAAIQALEDASKDPQLEREVARVMSLRKRSATRRRRRDSA